MKNRVYLYILGNKKTLILKLLGTNVFRGTTQLGHLAQLYLQNAADWSTDLQRDF